MLDDDAFAQIAVLAERRSPSIWPRLHRVVSSDIAVARLKESNLPSPFALALVFWGLSYILFTVRALTISTDALLLSELRFFTTGVGALLVGLFLAQVDEKTIARNAIILRILVVTVCASLMVWTARNLHAAFAPEPFTSVADNARWAMFWAGYCASFLSLYLLYRAKAGRMQQPQADAPASNLPVTAREVTLSWLVDALADELQEKTLGLDEAFFDRVARDLQVGMVPPQGASAGSMTEAVDEVIGRLRRHYSPRSSGGLREAPIRGRRLAI